MRELVLTRIFNALPDRAWKAYTLPESLSQWWGPNGFALTTQEMDLKPGGIWRFVAHGSDGRDYSNKIRYIEVKQPEYLVYAYEGENGETIYLEVKVTLTEQGGKTVVEMRFLFPAAEKPGKADKEYDAIVGAKQHMTKFGLYLAKSAPEPDLILERSFNAPRAQMFNAWHESEHLAQWWGPEGFTIPVCKVDFRIGGSMNIHMQSPEGTVYPISATFYEIDEPEKIVFSSGPLNEQGELIFEVLHTILFIEENNKTKLTLQASVASINDPKAEQYLQGMKQRWSQSLDKLVDYISKTNK